MFLHTQNYQGSVQSQAITFNANDAVKIVSDPGWVNNDQPDANKEEWTYDQRNVQNINDQVSIYLSKKESQLFCLIFMPLFLFNPLLGWYQCWMG